MWCLTFFVVRNDFNLRFIHPKVIFLNVKILQLCTISTALGESTKSSVYESNSEKSKILNKVVEAMTDKQIVPNVIPIAPRSIMNVTI